MNKKRTFGMSLLVAAFLLLSDGAAGHAGAEQTRYDLNFWSDAEELCVGQETLIGVQYYLNGGENETNFPKISVAVTNGTLKEGDKNQRGGRVLVG
jgi:hypothetical protein